MLQEVHFFAIELATCGSYGFKLPSTVVCSEIKDGPNPQVAHLNSKRLVYCEEPSRSRRVYAGTVKELTGAKKLSARLCNDSHCDKTLRLTFKVGCSTVPRFDEVSEAVNRRLRAIPYESKFLTQEDYDQLEDSEKLSKLARNPELDTDTFTDEYRVVFFDTLKEYFQSYVHSGPGKTPAKSKLVQDSLMATSDDLYSWFLSALVADESEYVKFKDVYNQFEWSQFYQSMSKKDKREFSQQKFKQVIKDSYHLGKSYKKKDFYFQKQKLSFESTTGWKLKSASSENADDDSEDVEVDSD